MNLKSAIARTAVAVALVISGCASLSGSPSDDILATLAATSVALNQRTCELIPPAKRTQLASPAFRTAKSAAVWFSKMRALAFK